RMPPAALISFTASLTPSLKLVPDVVPVPDSSTNPKTLMDWPCANSGCADARFSRNAAMQAMERMGFRASVMFYACAGRRNQPGNSRAEADSAGRLMASAAIENTYRFLLTTAAQVDYHTFLSLPDGREMQPELRHLRAFLAVADQGSTNRASMALYRAQSA